MSDVNWHGHDFAFRLRVDVEHVESERYLGDYRLERVSVVNMLDMFSELGVNVSFCVLGITAELFPNLINDIVEAGHEVYGHGMYHEPAFAGRGYREQRHEMLRMRQSIADACGVKVDGIGCPHHGMADEDTLQAAADVGITYVESRIRGTDSEVPVWRSLENSDKRVLVPGGLGKGASDYTDRRPFWADLHEEAFSPTGARQKWMALIDWAKENRSMTGIVVHPWMLMINAGEVRVVKDVIKYAVDEGCWMATVKGLISLAEKESLSTSLRAGSGEREK